MNEYLKLLAQRECKVVLGKYYANLWLLVVVLVATFISIAFSNGSLIYLSEKMNDPFTNWVNISNEYNSGKYDDFRRDILDDKIQNQYLFSDVQSDNYWALSLVGKNQSIHYLQCRFFEQINSDLVSAILSEDNVVSDCAISKQNLTNSTLGFVITQDVLTKLGYSVDSIPAYVNYLTYAKGADSLGVDLIETQFASTPMPILGVVKKLPMNMDIIASNYFYEQYNNESKPLLLNKEGYHRELYYFVDASCQDFEARVKQVIPDSLKMSCQVLESENSELKSWKSGTQLRVYVGDEINTPTSTFIEINKEILSKFSEEEITRIYNYETTENPMPSLSSYVSVQFASLDSIRAFERFAKENYNVQIEMSQVNAKENFNAVSVMANILSWAMIIFSIVCIIMFIINMLQSYFQKVKRNLGTFKAFGISTSKLIGVYVLIILSIIIVAIVIALLFAWCSELLLPLIGIMKDGEYSYLSLWNLKTILSIIIIVASALVTVYVVMKHLLSKTPGDLIYDRG